MGSAGIYIISIQTYISLIAGDNLHRIFAIFKCGTFSRFLKFRRAIFGLEPEWSKILDIIIYFIWEF